MGRGDLPSDWLDVRVEPLGSRPRRHGSEVDDEALAAWHAQPDERFAADLACAITYVARDGAISTRRISIRQVMERAGSIYLVAFCHERGAMRHFRLDGVRACWDAETGEVIDLQAYIRTLQPTVKPAEGRVRKRRRTEDLGDGFDRLGCPQGWVFDVIPAFRAALDVQLTELVDRERTKRARAVNPKAAKIMRRAWTRGVPPVLAFERGHIIYDRNGTPAEGGRSWLRGVRRIVQVREAKPDVVGTGGWVAFELWPVEANELGESSLHRCSQADFAAFLRNGVLPTS
jgi:hypothetical protein